MKKYLLIVLLFAIVIRLLMLHFIVLYPLGDDAIYYYTIGENTAEGKGFQYYGELPNKAAPLYPLFLALIFKIFGAGQMQIYYAQTVLDLIAIILIFILGKLIIDEKVGLLAAALYSIHPSAIVFTRTVLTENLMVFLVILFFVLLYLAIQKEKNWLFFTAGLVGLLAALTRWVFAFFPGICFFWILFYFRKDMKKALRYAFSFIAIFIILSIPYLIHFGRAPLKNGVILIKQNLLVEKHFVRDAFSLWKDVVQKEVIYRGKDAVYFSDSPFHPYFNYFMHKFMIGAIFFSIFLIRFNIKNILLYIFLIYWTIIHLLLYSIPRYQMGAVPILIMIFSILCFRVVEIRRKCG